ncbi:MAG: hypothetical protein JWQ09_5976 [Segetibacter sp.]|nr:hypothetical protein [Segetibacter sp.]
MKSFSMLAVTLLITSIAIGQISGTVNNLSKFVTATSVGNSIVYDNGTNVGIGTTTPGTNKLLIKGGLLGIQNAADGNGWAIDPAGTIYGLGNVFATFSNTYALGSTVLDAPRVAIIQSTRIADPAATIDFKTGGNIRARIENTGEMEIGTSTILNSSAILNVTSLTQGVLLPRMTNTQIGAIASPTTGLLAWSTTDGTLKQYQGTGWASMVTQNATGNVAIGIAPVSNSAITVKTVLSTNGFGQRWYDFYGTNIANMSNTAFEATTINSLSGVGTGLTVNANGVLNFNQMNGNGYPLALGSISSANFSVPISNGYVSGVYMSRPVTPLATSTNFQYRSLQIDNVINYTNATTSNATGVYVNPTLTAVTDYRAFESLNGSLTMTDANNSGSAALAGSLMNLSQTWNTTGAPTAILLNVTNTASAFTSNLMDLQVAGNSIFRVRKDGNVRITAVSGSGGNIQFGSGGSPAYISGNNGTSTIAVTGLLSNLSTSALVINNTGSATATTGIQGTLNAGITFAPTSGTAVWNGISINDVINQTGGANGIARGLYVNPTLTAAADFRAIETTQGSLVMNDTYLSGSGALGGSLLNLSQTWNTTGSPTAIKLNVTNTASGSAANLIDLQVGAVSKFKVDKSGNVGIGIATPLAGLDVNTNVYCRSTLYIGLPDGMTGTQMNGSSLGVNGTATFKKAVVRTYGNWPDFVFESNYKLRSLDSLELFIKTKKHLPDMPAAADVEKNGIDLGDNQAILLKKVEELTLYMIEMNKKVESLSNENEVLKKKLVVITNNL